MKNLLFLLPIFAALTFSSCNKPRKEKTKNEKPNILFIFSDDHATHAIHAYGPKENNPELYKVVKTPNIDRLADEGMLFHNTFCTNSICGPSRAVILTGKHSHINGFINNDTTFNGAQQTFPKILKKNGYETAWIGKWHLISEPTGFSYWKILTRGNGQGIYYNPIFTSAEGKEEKTGYTSTLLTDEALDWLKNKRDKTKPFFLMYSHKAPHREWMPGPGFYDAYKDVTIPLPVNFYDDYSGRSSAAKEQEMEVAKHLNKTDLKLEEPPYMNEEQLAQFHKAFDAENEAKEKANLTGKKLAEWKYQRYMKTYLGSITSMDAEIGRVIDYLKSSGLDKNTVVIYSSDQGFYLGDHGWFDKRWMYEESLRMPFIVKWPGVVKPGTKNYMLTQNLDFAETLLDIAGVEIPADMQGKSILPLLKNQEPENWRKYIYYHYWGYPDWHMVRQHYGIRSDRYKLIHYYTIGEWELFDLKEDPMEMHSVYNEPAYADIQSKMTKDLNDRKLQVGDTLQLKSSSVYHAN